MTKLTQDLLASYAAAIANEAAICEQEAGSETRWEAAKLRLRETRARLADHLNKLEEMAMPVKGTQ